MGYSSYFIPLSSSSHIIPIILIITCSLLIPIAFPIEDTEVAHICLPNTKNFTIAYNQSRALVVGYLILNTASSPNEGFRNANYTWFQDPKEWAYGLALCRGDVSPDDCKACVNNSAQALIYTRCPDSRAAIIWHDYCFLKYSDIDFFRTIDADNKFSLMGDWNWNGKASEDAAKNFTANLTQTAVLSPKLYAYETYTMAKPETYPSSHGPITLYGMAQCTRDLDSLDCFLCLEAAREGLANVKVGGRVVLGSCSIRYETYNFNSSAIN